MNKIETHIAIEAPATTVWKVLMAFDNYPEWNPFIISIKGNKVQGGQLEVQIKPPQSKAQTFKPQIKQLIPNKTFQWQGKLLLPGIFDGTHLFEIEEQSDHKCLFKHSEEFKGLLVPLFKKTLEKTAIGFQEMNMALKIKCETK